MVCYILSVMAPNLEVIFVLLATAHPSVQLDTIALPRQNSPPIVATAEEQIEVQNTPTEILADPGKWARCTS
jgi:hypothetical protein